MIDVELKKQFRDEKCNIVEMTKNKIAVVPKGSKILNPLQSQEEFNELLSAENWGITQTLESNIIFIDLDSNEYHKGFDKFFNRRRDKYVNHSEFIKSKHGFLALKILY